LITQEELMTDNVYKHIELTGTSASSLEDAVQKAVTKASETVRNLRWLQVNEIRGAVENGKVTQWQVTVKIGFTLEG
jgi:flavin-binding protein dodecin